MTHDLVCLVPLRSPGEGKTRLAPGLDRAARAALAGAMLADVVAALRGAAVGPVVVAANGSPAAAAASALRADVVVDPPEVRGLDAAVEHARRRVAPDRDLLVVQADLPLLAPADVVAMVDSAGPVVLAPTADGGTGALLRRPSGSMPTAFGADSAVAHRDLARRHGLEATIVHRRGLATDVDTWSDLTALAGQVGGATANVLERLERRPAG